MRLRIQKHLGYYISVLGIFFLGIVGVAQLSYDRWLQASVVFIITIFYVILGALHHMLHHDLSVKIMVEYVLIGVMGAVVVLFVLGGRV